MITIYKSFVTKISIFALVAIFISIPSVAFADTTTINSVSLNGASSVTVAPSATISASVSVTTNTSGGGGSSTWDATGWRISTSSGTYACVDTANHSGNGTNSETFNITAPSTPGTYNIYLATYSNYYNGYGCYGQNDTFSQNSVVTVNVVDTTSPSVTINQKSSAPAQADPTSSSPINFTVVFSESVSDFATGDVTLSGTAGATTATVTGSGTTYNVAVSGMTSSGTVIATIAAGKAHDAAGNPNTVSTSTDNTVTYNVADTTPPSLSQVTPISTQTGDTTPSYVFSSTEAGAVTYGGSCGNGDLANAAAGNNTVTFGSLSAGTYNNCTITVTDAAHNASTPLDISSFTVNTDLFEKGMVTLSFDDGTAGQFANAHIVNDAGFKATYYIISGMMNGATACDGDCYADFMTQANVQSLFSTGNEIAAHTRTHQDLTTQNDGQLRFEIEGSRSDLLSTIGAPVSNLAFPYGTTNDTVDQELKNAGFVGSRTVIDGLNTRSTNRYELYADQVLSDTDVSEVEGWIDQAANNDEWLVLVFHKIDAGCSNPDGVPIPPEDGGGNDNYCATPSTLASIVSYLQSKESSIDVVTVSQGLAKMDNSPVSDGVAPVITQPDIVAEATSPTGASVSFSPVVTDLDTGLPASPLSTLCTIPHVPVVDEDPATVFPTIVTSGDEFPMGVTTVTCTAADTAGNYTSHPFTITVQNSAVPSVTLTTTAPAITNTSPIHVTATFSEDVTGFEATDVAVTNGTVENFDGSGSVYTFDVVPTDDGEVTVNVPENISIDIAGGNNTASNTLSTTYDNTPPIVTIDDYTTDPTNQDITVTAHTNEGTLNADSNTFTENGTFDFIATDLAGNQSTKTVTITNIDKTAPDITINNPGTDPAQSKTLTASVSDGTLLQSVTTGDVCDATLTFGPYTDLTFSTEADNGTIICYQAADALGNTDYKLSDAIGGIDTTAPAITAVNIASNNPTPTLAKPGDTVTIGFTATEILATPTVTVDGNSADVTGTNPYTATYTMAGSDPDGAVTFAIDYTDLAGNAGTEVSSTTDASTVTFDGTAPTITVDSFPTVNSDDQTSVTLSGTCSDTDGAISLTIDTVSDSPTCTTGTWSSTLDLSSLLDGSLTATASQTDAAGNIGTGTLDATKDTVAPIVTIDTIPTVTNGTPTITGTTDDDADVTVTVDGTDYTATPSSGTWSVTTNVLTDGSTLSATAQSTDAAGNTGAIATSNDFTVDAAAPIITVTDKPDEFTNSTNASISFTVDDTSAIVACVFDTATVDCSSGTYSTTVGVGPHTFTITATDSVGNTTTEEIDFTVDTTAPTLSINNQTTNDNTPTITGSSDDSADVSVTVNGTTYTATPDGSSAWSVEITDTLADDTYDVTASSTDAAGNVGTASGSITVDTTLPGITIDPVAANATTITGTTDDATNVVTLTIDGTGVAVTEDDAGNWSATVPSLSEAIHDVTATATNTLGSHADQSTNLVIDTTGPTITLNGDNPEVLEVGTAYVELGATATDTVDTSVDAIADASAVDMNHLGDYPVTYNATDFVGNTADSVTRTVSVVDTTKPVITLNGSNPMSVVINTAYTEPGATVSDNYDSGLSATIDGSVDTSTLGSYEVTYNATDTSGNIADEVTRTVNVVEVPDTTPPVITLNGSGSMTITLNGSFTDPGATATDDKDGSVAVTVGGDTVDTGVAGTYHITYDAVDSAGNHASQVVRTVTIKKPTSGGGGGGGSSSGGSSSSTSNTTTTTTQTGQVLGESTTCLPYLSQNLSLGAKNADVQKLQSFLNAQLGLSLSVDGAYGPKTAAAVKAFQLAHADKIATASGTVDETTRALIDELSCEGGTQVLGAEKFIFTQTLRVGSKGNEVTELQKRLTLEGVYSGPITGYFGPLTKAGVIAYQNKNGLTPDGVVGPMTRALLNQ